MSPEIGTRILIGSETGETSTQVVVVGHDLAGNPVTIPDYAAKTPEALDKHLGVTHAVAVRAQVLMEMPT